jgi:hypothetical protein
MFFACLLPLVFSTCTKFDMYDDYSDLAEIHYEYTDLWGKYDWKVTIHAGGQVHIEQQIGDVVLRPIVSDLTPGERSRLIQAFKGWKYLDQSYSIDVGKLYQITYNDLMVTTSSPEKAPEPFRKAKKELDEIVVFLIKAAQDKTAAEAAATQNATQPATMPDGTVEVSPATIPAAPVSVPMQEVKP